MSLNTRLVTIRNEVVLLKVLNRRLCAMAEKFNKDDSKALAETQTGHPVRLKRVPTTPLRRSVCRISFKVHSRLDETEYCYNHCSRNIQYNQSTVCCLRHYPIGTAPTAKQSNGMCPKSRAQITITLSTVAPQPSRWRAIKSIFT